MTTLSSLTCVPCLGGVPPLDDEQITPLLSEVPEWQVLDVDGVRRLERVFTFKDFAAALDFTNQVGALAEQQGHHPLLVTEWGRVTVQWWTHKIKGLHKNDFIMAARTDLLMTGG
jgi:4a-hydroxytetrahydrobiopterin dehydratase